MRYTYLIAYTGIKGSGLCDAGHCVVERETPILDGKDVNEVADAIKDLNGYATGAVILNVQLLSERKEVQ